MANAVISIRLLKACVTRHDITKVANSVHNGTPTANRFKNGSVLSGWYQACLSLMIAKGDIKSSSGNVPHDVKLEAWCTSYNPEAFYSLYASEMVKYGISEYNTSYYKTVEVSEEIIVTHPSHLIFYDDTKFC